MNKSFYCICFFLLFVLKVKSQFSFYAASGVNLSNVSILDPNLSSFYFKSNTYSQVFFTLGADIPLSEKIHFIGEVSYSPNGYKSVSPVEEFSYTVKYQNINIQPGISYKFNPIRLELGAFMSTSFNDKIRPENGTWSENKNTTETLNFGAFAGLNISVLKNVSVFGRYYIGLSNFSSITYTDFDGFAAGKTKAKVKNIQVGISVSF